MQIVTIGPGLAWNETFPKEEALEMRGFISYVATSAIEALRFLRTDPHQKTHPGSPKPMVRSSIYETMIPTRRPPYQGLSRNSTNRA